MMKELDYFGLETAVFGARLWTDDAAFRPGPEMNEDRGCCCVVAAGGRVMVFGGEFGDDTTEVLDTQTMTFTDGPDMLTARSGFAAVQIDADRVLLVGGVGDNGDALNTTGIFHLSTRAFTPGPGQRVLRAVQSGPYRVRRRQLRRRRRHRAAEDSPRSRATFPCDLLSSPPLIPRSFYLSKL
mmetsp:Transcript_23769/g.80219  ORF Transcript_23769/g.80219 Transcript_23769/m.80219 type:complete len:183 (-) Transcript_23769:9-557(-)